MKTKSEEQKKNRRERLRLIVLSKPVKSLAKQPDRDAHLRPPMLCITNKETDESHRFLNYFSHGVIGDKKGFTHTTKNKFRSHEKDMAKLSPELQMATRAEYLLTL